MPLRKGGSACGGRVALSLLVGAALLVVGVARIRQAWRHQGGILVAVGATTLLFTNWLAWYYELITPLASLALIFAVVAFMGVLSVVYAMRSLAIVGFLLSGFAPLLTAVAPWQPGVVPMLLYLFAVICATLWLALFAGWIELVPATLFLVFLHYVPLWDNARHLSDIEHAIAFSAGFGLTGIVWLAGTVGLVGYLWEVGAYPRRSRLLGYAATAFLNAFFFATNIFVFTPEHTQSLWLAGGSVMFALGAYVGVRLARDPSLFLPYGLASFALLLTALMRELEGAPLLVLTTAASVAFVLMTLRWGRTVLSVAIGASTFLIPAVISLPIWQEAAGASRMPWEVLDASLLALFLFILALGGTAYLLYLRAIEFDRPADVRIISGVLGTFAFLFSLRFVWIVCERLFSPPEVAVFITLALYTVVGIVLYFRGMERKQPWLQRYGAALIGFVAFRLLFIDVWALGLLWRTITFIGLGLLLLATGFWREQVLAHLGIIRSSEDATRSPR
ncbi:MAG: hypothetical protein KatS3mg099_280 [Candidatus Parcubacteria bacterium]|nr:MAG: hypothetical protein KatS3mg099_280 [Candidatus Parcubacteria bacterium]